MPAFDLRAQRNALRSMMATLPHKCGVLAVAFFKESFRRGGWMDESFTPWKPRSAKAKRNKGRALLVDTGRLRRAIRVVKRSGDSVTIGNDAPYARAQNEGFDGTVNVRGHTRRMKMPQRQ